MCDAAPHVKGDLAEIWPHAWQGELGLVEIRLPPEEPVSHFILVGGQNVTQADDKDCHYKGSRLQVIRQIPDADPDPDIDWVPSAELGFVVDSMCAFSRQHSLTAVFFQCLLNTT